MISLSISLSSFSIVCFPLWGGGYTAAYYEAQEKLAAVRGWRNAWLSSAQDAMARVEGISDRRKTIFVWDMDSQSAVSPISSDVSEVFWKGFVEALDILGREEIPHRKGFRYIAVINLSGEQIAAFRRLCQAYLFKEPLIYSNNG